MDRRVREDRGKMGNPSTQTHREAQEASTPLWKIYKKTILMLRAQT